MTLGAVVGNPCARETSLFSFCLDYMLVSTELESKYWRQDLNEGLLKCTEKALRRNLDVACVKKVIFGKKELKRKTQLKLSSMCTALCNSNSGYFWAEIHQPIHVTDLVNWTGPLACLSLFPVKFWIRVSASIWNLSLPNKSSNLYPSYLKGYEAT